MTTGAERIAVLSQLRGVCLWQRLRTSWVGGFCTWCLTYMIFFFPFIFTGTHHLPRGLYFTWARNTGEDDCCTALSSPCINLSLTAVCFSLCLFLYVYQKRVIEWLLKHDPALRPTALELLKSELLPPPQMEESELHEVLQHTMANINGKSYRTMVAQLFAQNTSPVMDYAYDIDLYKVRSWLSWSSVCQWILFYCAVLHLCWMSD